MSVTPSIADDDEDARERDTVSEYDFVELHADSFQKRRKKLIGSTDVPPAVRERMKKAFVECYKAVLACVDDETDPPRKRFELFREIPDKKVRTNGLLVSLTEITLIDLP